MNVFISYSQADSELVSSVVSVLSAGSGPLVYCDAESIRGDKQALRAAIAQTDVVLLFWCHHSFTSYDVRKDSTLAIELGKDVLPLLLDATPLPGKLSDRASIDFRDRVAAIHEGSPDQTDAQDMVARAEVERSIASGMSSEYEELLVMSLAREIEAALASKLGLR